MKLKSCPSFDLVPSRSTLQMTIGGVLVAAEVLFNTAAAAAIDVSATVTGIVDQLFPIALIGGAVSGVYLALRAYQWVRFAMLE